MSYSNTNRGIVYDGDSLESFAVNFYYLEGDTQFITAELWDYNDPDNPVKQSFIEGVHYEILEAGNYPNTIISTAGLYGPVPNPLKVKVIRVSDAIQNANFIQGQFPAESVEEALDRALMVAQENKEAIERCVKAEFGDPAVDLGTLPADVAANTVNIATNTSDIATNVAAIATNTANIANNTSAISTNVTDIGNLQSGKADVETLVPYATASGTYNANVKDIVLVKAASVTVALPAAALSAQVKVKLGDSISSCTITTAASIDGFGASYALSSEYASVSLVSDGSKWYII